MSVLIDSNLFDGTVYSFHFLEFGETLGALYVLENENRIGGRMM